MFPIDIIGIPIFRLNWKEIISQIQDWALKHESKYVCICNVHSLITANQNTSYAEILRNADITTPDGAPIAWMMRRLGAKGQERINGPDLMWRYCAEAATREESIYLFGGKENTLLILQEKLHKQFPSLQIAGIYSPPFRPLTAEEDEAIITRINASGAATVWVSLGCPKQEKWMAEHKGRVNAVMIGVGAAFDYHAGTIKRAPVWMQRRGLEWLHRLCSEPRRLWKRYFVTNSLFILYASRQLITRTSRLD